MLGWNILTGFSGLPWLLEPNSEKYEDVLLQKCRVQTEAEIEQYSAGQWFLALEGV